jgi:hypothetical protein
VSTTTHKYINGDKIKRRRIRRRGGGGGRRIHL